MTERFQSHEAQPSFPELSPSPRVVDALRGVVSDPLQVVSHRPGSEGQLVTVRLAQEGPCMFGLTDGQDNRKWAGIFNHSIRTARYAAHLAQVLAQRGYEINPQRILDSMVVSHAGRRQWDEAGRYPYAISGAAAIRSISNETLGMQLIQGKVPQEVFELVVALGHNVESFSVDSSIYDSWDYRIAIYVDHRTTQRYEPLHTRMGDFLLGNFFQRSEVTPEVRERVYAGVKNIIERQKDHRLGKEGAEGVTLDEADWIAESLGARLDSERVTRRDLMRQILQDADTEAVLIHEGIDPDALNDETVPMPKWEDALRREYVEAAKDSIVSEFNSHEEFLENSWWSVYAREAIKS